MTTATMKNAADLKWGFEFGVEGVMSIKSTAEFLDKSEDTVWRLINAGHLRKGKPDSHSAKWMVCRRSVLNYLKAIER